MTDGGASEREIAVCDAMAHFGLKVAADVRAKLVHCFKQLASHECVIDAFFAAHRLV